MVSAAEGEEIEQGLTSYAVMAADTPHVEEHKISWRALFSRIDLPALMVSNFAFGYTSYVFFNWFYL